MNRNYDGLDVVRGIGIFGVVLMHTAFYHFDGVWEIDFASPPIVITLIGFLLMFAGLFAMVSGFAHTARYEDRLAEGQRPRRALASRVVSGLFILATAYVYFLFTGPGIVHFETQTWSNSVLVELIRTGTFPGFSPERVLYIDSLVMIGMNAILVGLFLTLLRVVRREGARRWIALGAAVAVLVVSLLRIPLYEAYLHAVENGNRVLVYGLNWLVNKNNPLLPYAAFALFGTWLGLEFRKDEKRALRRAASLGALLFAAGVALYILLPDTMLERAIDSQWYAIMVLQAGLFMLFLCLALWLYDVRKTRRTGTSRITRFFRRLGIAGLSIYFVESVVSALVFRAVSAAWPGFHLGMYQAVAVGLLLAIAWGLALIAWEKTGYRFGLERLYCRTMRWVGGSAKEAKLRSAKR
jgi:surface polysaccharide O-acyltransferase-like enzyme